MPLKSSSMGTGMYAPTNPPSPPQNSTSTPANSEVDPAPGVSSTAVNVNDDSTATAVDVGSSFLSQLPGAPWNPAAPLVPPPRQGPARFQPSGGAATGATVTLAGPNAGNNVGATNPHAAMNDWLASGPRGAPVTPSFDDSDTTHIPSTYINTTPHNLPPSKLDPTNLINNTPNPFTRAPGFGHTPQTSQHNTGTGVGGQGQGGSQGVGGSGGNGMGADGDGEKGIGETTPTKKSAQGGQ